jgi:DNA-binding Xre family transcriptional regulator
MMAKHLRRFFIEVDMNASQVADEIGVGRSLMSMMANGKAKITPRTAKQLQQLRSRILRDGHLARISKLSGRSVEELENL